MSGVAEGVGVMGYAMPSTLALGGAVAGLAVAGAWDGDDAGLAEGAGPGDPHKDTSTRNAGRIARTFIV